MCLGIIRNNSLVGGRAPAESNPSLACHALLHIAAECVNHSATRAGLLSGGIKNTNIITAYCSKVQFSMFIITAT